MIVINPIFTKLGRKAVTRKVGQGLVMLKMETVKRAHIILLWAKMSSSHRFWHKGQAQTQTLTSPRIPTQIHISSLGWVQYLLTQMSNKIHQNQELVKVWTMCNLAENVCILRASFWQRHCNKLDSIRWHKKIETLHLLLIALILYQKAAALNSIDHHLWKKKTRLNTFLIAF